MLGYGNANLLDQAFHPVECAIAKNDNVARLLIAIGGAVDIGCRRAHGNEYPKTIGDWAKFAVGTLEGRIKARKAQLATLLAETVSDAVVVKDVGKGWKSYLANEEAKRVKAGPPASDPRKTLQEDITRLEETFEYLQDINSALIARDAKTWNEVYPDKLTTLVATTYANYNEDGPPKLPDPATYATLNSYGNGRVVPQHQVALYDELFEACFTGNNEKVQDLCLSADGKHENQPLNIFVQVANPTNIYVQTGTFFPLLINVTC